LVQEAQLRMLEVLAETRNAEEYHAKIPKILDLLLDYSLILKNGQAKSESLAIRRTISQTPNDYKVDSPIALAAQQLEDSGIPIHPGEKLSYIIKDAQSRNKNERVRPFPLMSPDDTYDAGKYQEMLFKATEEILIHMGYDWKRLHDWIDPFLSLGHSIAKPRRRSKKKASLAVSPPEQLEMGLTGKN
jgi:DNA polymerase elongation subunit (family B)